MRIIVISDTHGNVNAIESVFLRNHDADLFIHLGDGDRDLDTFLSANPDYVNRTVNVCGNCDFNSLTMKFQQAVKNPAIIEKMMSTPQAQALYKKLSGGK